MRFFYVKKEQICQGCKSTLNHNDEAVVILININGAKVPFVFHVECYLTWDTRMFTHRLETWRQGSTRRPARRRKAKPKVGRPRKYSNQTMAIQLKALIHYHRKEGNEEQVKELESKLEEIKL